MVVFGTNITLESQLTFYEVAPSEFGVYDITGDGIKTPAHIEKVNTSTHADFSDEALQTIQAWIEPDSAVYMRFDMTMPEKVRCEYGDKLYRVAAVEPGGSLISGQADFVGISLEEVQQPNE